MKKKYKSFAGRLTRNVVLTVLVTMTIISVFVFIVAASGMLVLNKAHYSDIMDKANGNMAMIMSKVEVSAENIIDELSWHLVTPEVVSSTLEYELNVNRHVSGCGIGFVPDFFPEQGRWCEPYALNTGGEIVMKNIGSASHDYFDDEWYVKGLASPEGVWTNPYLDKDGAGTVLCTFSRLVIAEPEGVVAGVFGADISLDELSALIVESIKKENEESPFLSEAPKDPKFQIYSFIIGPDGDYIVHPDRERILRTNFYDYAIGKDADKYRKLGNAMRAGEKGEKALQMDGVKSYVYFSPLLQSGWSMGIVVPVKRLLMPGFLFGTMIIMLILIGLLIVFFICRLAIQKSSKPLMRLAESTEEIAKGKFDTEIPQIETDDELRLLRDSFDDMRKSLAQYVDELTETTSQKASYERELSVARGIQMSMLPMKWPAFPDRTDIDIYGCVIPAKAVGGDMYEFRLRDGKLFFCVGDVSGKGVPASLVMALISSMFRTLSTFESNPVKIVSHINSSMSARNENMMFVTLFVGALDLSTGELQYCNAGHNAPAVISNGKASMLEVDPNLPIGVVHDWEYSLQNLKLSKDSMFFLYTDGLTEATRSDGQLFGDDRVLEKLSSNGKNISAERLITQMIAAVSDYVGEAEQSDDLTMLALRVLSKEK